MSPRSGSPRSEPPRVLILLGTRPEAIKLAPVAAALAARPEELRVDIVSTGQHEELLDDALASLGLEIEENLGIMEPDQDLYTVGAACLDRLRDTFQARDPDVVVVEGDTASVFFGALGAFFQGAQVAHVEAGLRSGDKWAPFPEEIFRRLTDVVADLLFAPTPGARVNLLEEGVPAERVHVTGNTVVDAVQTLASRSHSLEHAVLRSVLDDERRIVLVTVHRREAFGEPIREIFRALKQLAEGHPDDIFVYPVHPNPNVRMPASEILAGLPNFLLVDPLPYTDLVQLLSRAWMVLTDSGGIQEEAPSFGVPVLVLREVTERPEGVEAGVAKLVGTSRPRILDWGRRLLEDPGAHEDMSKAGNPYGDGRAGERIADLLIHRLLDVPRQTEDWDS